MTPDQFLTVVEDIEYLTAAWEGTDPIPEPEIRRGSCILRRLLVERELGKAWRCVGYRGEPTLMAVDLEALLGNYDRSAEALPFAFAGGGKNDGLSVAGFFLSKGTMPEPRLAPGQTTNDLRRSPFRLTAYIESPSLYVQGRAVKRREIIKYMANVRGGVHLDGREDEQLVRELQAIEKSVNVHVLNGLFFELLAIGQTVATSPDCLRIVETVRGLQSASLHPSEI